jgi:lipid-binding SYLF domain-containing protein
MERIGVVKGSFAVLCMAFALIFCLQADSYALISSRDINEGADIAIRNLREKKGSAEALDKAKGILVFPGVFKGAIGLGGQYGEGALRVGGKTEGYYSIGSISFGLSLGGEKKSIVIAFMTDDALKSFREGSGWTIGGEGSLAIITVGAGYETSIATVNKPLIAFVFGEKGLMYDLSLAGSKVTKINR